MVRTSRHSERERERERCVCVCRGGGGGGGLYSELTDSEMPYFFVRWLCNVQAVYSVSLRQVAVLPH